MTTHQSTASTTAVPSYELLERLCGRLRAENAELTAKLKTANSELSQVRKLCAQYERDNQEMEQAATDLRDTLLEYLRWEDVQRVPALSECSTDTPEKARPDISDISDMTAWLHAHALKACRSGAISDLEHPLAASGDPANPDTAAGALDPAPDAQDPAHRSTPPGISPGDTYLRLSTPERTHKRQPGLDSPAQTSTAGTKRSTPSRQTDSGCVPSTRTRDTFPGTRAWSFSLPGDGVQSCSPAEHTPEARSAAATSAGPVAAVPAARGGRSAGGDCPADLNAAVLEAARARVAASRYRSASPSATSTAPGPYSHAPKHSPHGPYLPHNGMESAGRDLVYVHTNVLTLDALDGAPDDDEVDDVAVAQCDGSSSSSPVIAALRDVDATPRRLSLSMPLLPMLGTQAEDAEEAGFGAGSEEDCGVRQRLSLDLNKLAVHSRHSLALCSGREDSQELEGGCSRGELTTTN